MKGEWIIDGKIYYHSGFYRDLSDHYPVMQSFLLEAIVKPEADTANSDNMRPF